MEKRNNQSIINDRQSNKVTQEGVPVHDSHLRERLSMN